MSDLIFFNLRSF